MPSWQSGQTSSFSNASKLCIYRVCNFLVPAKRPCQWNNNIMVKPFPSQGEKPDQPLQPTARLPVGWATSIKFVPSPSFLYTTLLHTLHDNNRGNMVKPHHVRSHHYGQLVKWANSLLNLHLLTGIWSSPSHHNVRSQFDHYGQLVELSTIKFALSPPVNNQKCVGMGEYGHALPIPTMREARSTTHTSWSIKLRQTFFLFVVPLVY